MNIIFFILFLLCICIAAVLFVLSINRKKQLGVLTGDVIYQDHVETPGQILYSKTMLLMGKPDYLVRVNGKIIPIEVKTGKSPSREPYANHVMQLMAYCVLVEEHFGVAPPGGYIRYNEQEFKIEYSPEAKKAVKKLVNEILELRRNGKEPRCSHPYHNE